MVDCSSAYIWLLVIGENKNNRGEEHQLYGIHLLYHDGCLFLVGFSVSCLDEEYSGWISFSLIPLTTTKGISSAFIIHKQDCEDGQK